MPDRPHVSANFAISADGKISSPARRASGWTSAADHRRLLELRRDADALLVGRGTLEADRMTLAVPAKGAGETQPLRCVVSRSGRIDSTHPVFHTPGGPIHWLVTSPAPGFDASLLSSLGAAVHHCDLAGFLTTLHARHGVRRVHCEGGGELLRELLAIDSLDTLHLTWAGHTWFGGQEAPTLTGLPGDFLPASREFELMEFDPRPDLAECFLTYRRVS